MEKLITINNNTEINTVSLNNGDSKVVDKESNSSLQKSITISSEVHSTDVVSYNYDADFFDNKLLPSHLISYVSNDFRKYLREKSGEFVFIFFSGKQGSGKTTTALKLIEELINNYGISGKSILKMSFASSVKYIVNKIESVLNKDLFIKISSNQKATLYQIIGDDFGRKIIHKDIWAVCLYYDFVNYLYCSNWIEREYKKFFIVIDDWRYENEYIYLKTMFPESKSLTVRLNCSEEIRKIRSEKWRDNVNHESEISLDGYTFDCVFDSGVMLVDAIVQRTIGKLLLIS